MSSGSSEAWTIALVFDPASERRVRGFWTALSDRGLIEPNAGRPHLTVGRVSGDILERTGEILADLSENVGGARIAVDSLGVFTGQAPVLFLNPVPNGALLSLHRRVHAALRAGGIETLEQFHEPTRWAPHVTLGHVYDATQLGEAMTVANQFRLRFELQVTTFLAMNKNHVLRPPANPTQPS